MVRLKQMASVWISAALIVRVVLTNPPLILSSPDVSPCTLHFIFRCDPAGAFAVNDRASTLSTGQGNNRATSNVTGALTAAPSSTPWRCASLTSTDASLHGCSVTRSIDGGSAVARKDAEVRCCAMKR